MPTRDALLDLEGRVQAAINTDRELDEALHLALYGEDPWWPGTCEGRRLVASGRPHEYVTQSIASMRAEAWAKSAGIPAYSTSLDVALALVARMLPGWSHEVHHGGFDEPARATLWNSRAQSLDDGAHGEHTGGSAPLAVLLALLKALLVSAGDAAQPAGPQDPTEVEHAIRRGTL